MNVSEAASGGTRQQHLPVGISLGERHCEAIWETGVRRNQAQGFGWRGSGLFPERLRRERVAELAGCYRS
ncbi:hypothetical protein [Burkholderia sp. BCC0405]|uniref:hypothetical protein n=1 Tax=Burkholderia sp. BCC0405 TaxID=2676298 RepID=UPI001588FB76|nr:hypothetical protein [Burkholderia sp. BCC0405]